jgi:hypothetical protein
MEVIDDGEGCCGFHHLDKAIVAASTGALGGSAGISMSAAVDVEVVDVIVVCVDEEDDEEVGGVIVVDVAVVVFVVVGIVTVVVGDCIRIEGVLADDAVDGCSNVCGDDACVGCMRMVRARRNWYGGDDGVGDVVV